MLSAIPFQMRGGIVMRHVLITAGTKGLGKKVTETLLSNGFFVTINYRSDNEAVEQLNKTWEKYSDQFEFVQADVTKRDDLNKLVQKGYDRFGPIHILINNAGPYVFERKKLAEYTDEEWYEMIEGNLSSVFHLCRKVIPMMREQGFGRIITYGFQGAEGTPAWLFRSAFAAAKVGLVSLTKTIAIEEAESGITANMVCPGNIVGTMKEATIKEARQKGDRTTPIGRSGTGEDIARVVNFLCNENSDMITGSIVEVTGGVDVLHRYR